MIDGATCNVMSGYRFVEVTSFNLTQMISDSMMSHVNPVSALMHHNVASFASSISKDDR